MSFWRRLFLGKTDKKDFLYVTDFQNGYALAIKKSISFKKPLVLVSENYEIIKKTRYYHHCIRNLKWHYGYIVLVDKVRTANKYTNDDKFLFDSNFKKCSSNYGKILFKDRYVLLISEAYTICTAIKGANRKDVLKINEDSGSLKRIGFFYYSFELADGAVVLDNGTSNAQVFIEETGVMKAMPTDMELINPKKRLEYNKYRIGDYYGYVDKNYNVIIADDYWWLGDIDKEGKVDYRRGDGHFGKIDLNIGKEIS